MVGADSAITCDDQQNQPASTALVARLPPSFALR
jgi:hypothetical protein